jgi:hypothetical protein
MVGIIGFALLVYAKKKRLIMPFISGVALSILPFILLNPYWLLLISVFIVALPFLLTF